MLTEVCNWIVGHAKNDWPVVKNAPIAVGVFVAVAASVTWYVHAQLVEQQLATKDSEISNLKTQIDGLNGRIDDYKERLGLVPRDATSFSKLTDAEVKTIAVTLVREMNDFNARYLPRRDVGSLSREQAFQSEVQFRREFGARFLARARNVHSELLARQPKIDGSRTSEYAHMVLADGTLPGHDPVGAVITHIGELSDRMVVRP